MKKKNTVKHRGSIIMSRKQKIAVEEKVKVVQDCLSNKISDTHVFRNWLKVYNAHGDFNSVKHYKLEKAGMKQSMSRVAKCIDNGPMEGFWGILKRERYYGKRFTSKKELTDMIENYIRYYNTRRVQRNLGVLTPMEKHNLFLAA